MSYACGLEIALAMALVAFAKKLRDKFCGERA